MEILLSEDTVEFLKSLDIKSKNICKKNLAKLENPHPGRGPGDKEKLVVAGEILYRLHIGRTYTAFYVIDDIEKKVRVLELLSIEAAHKRYGF